MQLRCRTFALPLLAKELCEQSAQWRTYAMRSCYALALLLFAWLATLNPSANDAFALLGKGRAFFDFVMGIQFAAVYLLMPAIAAVAVASEKQRNSLGLLFLTKLGPGTIVLEKLLSRVALMTVFLLMSIPLLAFTYGLGGIPQLYLWSGVWMMLVAVLQVGSIALACSCWCRTPVAAVLAAYVVIAGVSFGLPLLENLQIISMASLESWLFETFGRQRVGRVLIDLCGGNYLGTRWLTGLFFAPAMYFGFHYDTGFRFVIARSLPLLGSAIAALLLARFWLVSRAFVTDSAGLGRLFRFLDRSFARMNQNRFTRGVVLLRDITKLPGDEPVAWREVARRPYGNTRYVLRLLLALQIPTLAVVLTLGVQGTGRDLPALSGMIFMLFAAAALLVAVAASSLIAGERARQTLDLLLVTPMRGRDIVLQKLRGVRRLVLALCCPLLTAFGFQAWWRSLLGDSPEQTVVYLVTALLSLAIYLPLVAWLSLAIGMAVKSQTRAIFAAVLALVVLCLLPPMLPAMLAPVSNESAWVVVCLTSPAAILMFSELVFYQPLTTTGEPFIENVPLVVALNFAYHAAWLMAVRSCALSCIDRALGRRDPRSGFRGKSDFSKPPRAERVSHMQPG